LTIDRVSIIGGGPASSRSERNFSATGGRHDDHIVRGDR